MHQIFFIPKGYVKGMLMKRTPCLNKYALFYGLTDNMCRHFMSCVVFF